MSILLFDRVRLPDEKEGVVIREDSPDSSHVIVALQTGGSVSMLAALLQPIEFFSKQCEVQNARTPPFQAE